MIRGTRETEGLGNLPLSRAFGDRRGLYVGWAVTILLTVFVTGFVGWQVVRLRYYPFDSDEALHAVRGLALAFDLRNGDLLGFLQTAYRQSVYPPGFPLFEALVFLIFGASTLTARLSSLFCLFASIPLIYGIALELDREAGWLAGLIAAGLTLVSQGVLVHAGLVMLEMPGLFASLAALWSYLRARKKGSPWRFISTSLLVALVVLVKYPFGLIVVPTIFLSEVFLLLDEERPLLKRSALPRWLGLALPFLIVMIVWFAGEDKVADFIFYANLQPHHSDWYSLENLLYYPRMLVLHYLPAPIFAPVALASVVWAISRWSKPALRLVLFYFLIGFLLMTAKDSNNWRFIATVAPALNLLIGAMLAQLVVVWLRERRALRPLLQVAAACVILLSLASAPTLVERFAVFPALLEAEYETDPAVTELAEWITMQTAGAPVYFVNTWDQFSALALEWYLATADVGYDCCHGYLTVPKVHLEPFSDAAAVALEHDIRSYAPVYVVVLEGGVGVRQVWPEYARAFEGVLVPQVAHQVDVTLYDLGNWLNSSLVTRESLTQARIEHRLDLTARAIIYRLQEE